MQRGIPISEHQLQAAFFDWVRLQERQHPELALIHAIPNGSHKSISARMKFQREGLRPGVPDVHLPLPSKGHHSLWIEFKSKRGVVSDDQWRFITMLRMAGHRVEIVRTTEDAIAVVKEHLGI